MILLSKEQGKRKVKQLLLAYKLGLKESEIANLLDLNRRTVNSYLRELKKQGHTYQSGKYWFIEKDGQYKPTDRDSVISVASVIRRRGNEKLKAGDIARELNIHSQVVIRALVGSETLFYENDKGYLGILRP